MRTGNYWPTAVSRKRDERFLELTGKYAFVDRHDEYAAA
jgi:hypothetical protein